MEKSYEKNKPVDFYIDIKYWILEDGFLIAVSKTKMDNYNYQQIDFKFDYNDSKFIQFKNEDPNF